LLSYSANSRLIISFILALAVISTVSALLCYTYFIGLESLEPGSTLYNYSSQIKLLIIALFPTQLLVAMLLFRHQVHKCLLPLHVLTQKCARINIHNLNMRLTSIGDSAESDQFVAACNDMLERLETGAKRMRQFSGDASHELRTPLTILRGETEVALRWAKDSDEFRAAMNSNMEEIDRMGRIIEDLLTIAKSESGDLPLSIKQTSLTDLLQEIYLQGRTLAQDKQLELNLVHHASNEIIIYGDDLRLRQMFLNLLTNAIHYTNEHGEVTIEADQDEENAIVTISDTGIGISAEHLPYIFERFYRTDEDRNRSTGGTGLGLAIVKWIVETHAGTIEVNSTKGVGSHFKVTLPIAGPPTPIH